MKYALVNPDNSIANIINYDPASNWVPPSNFTLMQVNDWLNIGDNINKAAPVVSIPDPQQEIAQRNLALSRDYGVVAAFQIQKTLNPTLDFPTYAASLVAFQGTVQATIQAQLENISQVKV